MGNDKKVYIIYGKDYPLEKVKKEMEEEGYPYNFHFGRDVNAIHDAEEIWCFGNCNDEWDLGVAKRLGKSVWEMG